MFHIEWIFNAYGCGRFISREHIIITVSQGVVKIYFRKHSLKMDYITVSPLCLQPGTIKNVDI